MSEFNNGGELPQPLEPVISREREFGLTNEQWALLVEAVNWTIEQCRKDPKYRRSIRKWKARETKRQAIETRQVRRAEVIVNQAPPLLHNGKAMR